MTRHTYVDGRAAAARIFFAGEAGELAGVSGTTIGQWARWGYIRASQSAGDPHVYSVEDVAEAAIVSGCSSEASATPTSVARSSGWAATASGR